ncbi:MAG: DUF2262 domain-containing protein [Phycisphaerae bacterium]|nr:DUF2262 domain-containing protein [Phycisphaerae bacterium]
MDDFFERHKAKQRALLDRLSKAPPAEIVGVVDALGAGGSLSQGDTLWTLRFRCVAWRVASGPLCERALNVLGRMTKDDLNAMKSVARPHAIIRFQARLDESCQAEPHALWVNSVGHAEDDVELNAFLAKYLEPVTLDDSVLGTFTLDRRFGCWTAEIDWLGAITSLRVEPRDESKPEHALRVAREFWESQTEWTRKTIDLAVAKLLNLKNEEWLAEAETPATAADFHQRLTLESLSVRPDGSFEFIYDDGNLFWGHAIVVKGTSTGGLSSATLAG